MYPCLEVPEKSTDVLANSPVLKLKDDRDHEIRLLETKMRIEGDNAAKLKQIEVDGEVRKRKLELEFRGMKIGTVTTMDEDMNEDIPSKRCTLCDLVLPHYKFGFVSSSKTTLIW